MNIYLLLWYNHEKYSGQALWSKSVGKLNVSVQSAKHMKSKGAAIRGNYEILFII